MVMVIFFFFDGYDTTGWNLPLTHNGHVFMPSFGACLPGEGERERGREGGRRREIREETPPQLPQPKKETKKQQKSKINLRHRRIVINLSCLCVFFLTNDAVEAGALALGEDDPAPSAVFAHLGTCIHVHRATFECFFFLCMMRGRKEGITNV